MTTRNIHLCLCTAASIKIKVFITIVDELDAFNAIRNSTAIDLNIPVSFHSIDTTSQSNFNPSSMSLTNPSLVVQSLYWMHIAVDAPPFTSSTLQLSDKSMAIFVNQTTTNVTVTLAMSGVITVRPNTQLNLITFSNSSAIYWSAFRIDNLVYPLVAFRVVRTTSLTSMRQITFDMVLLNEGNAWNISESKFLAPYDGIYLFSFSGGIRYRKGAVLYLTRNTTELMMATGAYGDIFQSGVDLVSKTCLLNLNATDLIHLKLVQRPFLYSDSTYRPITFSGFYYNPIRSPQVGLKLSKLVNFKIPLIVLYIVNMMITNMQYDYKEHYIMTYFT